jgi:hypothetical protein
MPAALGGQPVAAGVSRASLVGGLSVPSTWTGGPSIARSAAALSVASTGAVPETGLPGMPGVAGRNNSRNARPRYGFHPSVITRPPAGG